MPEITIKNLSIVYKGKKRHDYTLAIDELNLSLKSGSFNAIVGYSGCGKTSLLKAIAGLLPYDGEILFDGKNMEKVPASKRNISFVSQGYILYPNMTVFDNIAYPLIVANVPKEEIKQRVYSIAEELGITVCLTRKPKHISGGQQQRVSLARAMIKHPSLFLLDEPLSNLDEPRRELARTLIKQVVNKYNVTTIYVTHNLNEAFALADNIVVINDGKVETEGSVKEILKSDNEVVKSLKNTGIQW